MSYWRNGEKRMKLMINGLLFVGLCITAGVAVFVTSMVLYLLKEAKWESNLKRYTIDGDSVINPYGYEINARQLLEELMDIEERITNDK